MTTLDLRNHEDAGFRKLASALAAEGAGADAAFFVPGRIEVLGKHTDYAGGRSLLCAVSHGFSIAVAAGSGDELRVVNADTGEEVVFSVAEDTPDVPGHWSNYVRVAARRMATNFGADRGGNIWFTSDLPIAAGISSSSALVVSVFLALGYVNRVTAHPAFKGAIDDLASLADYLGCLENGRDYPGLPGTTGVGTTGGSEDHTAILCAVPGQLQQFSFAPTRFEAEAQMPDDHIFVIASSGVSAEKTGAVLHDYNLLGSLGGAAVEAWERYTGVGARHLGDILSNAPIEDLVAAVSAYLSDTYPIERVEARVRQFHRETYELIPAAVAALHARDLGAFAEAVSASQHGAVTGLRNQVPETLHLVASAHRLGAVAASAFGAGFGGSVWAMVPASVATDFCDAWRVEYARTFPEPAERASFFVERPGRGARQMGVEARNGQILPVLP